MIGKPLGRDFPGGTPPHSDVERKATMAHSDVEITYRVCWESPEVIGRQYADVTIDPSQGDTIADILDVIGAAQHVQPGSITILSAIKILP